MYISSIVALNILFYVSFTSSETIKCGSGSESCHDETKTCMKYQECDIYCTADKSCQSTTFNCPTNSTCNVKCDPNSGKACQKTKFYVYQSQSASFLFEGSEDYQFADGHVSCATNSKCEIQCGTSGTGPDVCSQATFYAPYASELRITSHGDHSIDGAGIYCPETGDCFIDVTHGNDAMNHMNIFINDPSKVNLQISCPYAHESESGEGSNGCYGGGDHDIPILHCAAVAGSYKHECNLITYNGIDWHCSNKDSPCNINSHWSNSTEPTPVPTPSPTNTTAVPTRAPTNITAAPTKSPTNPTAQPTQSPTNTTAAPTKSPTNPTSQPTASPTNTTAAPTKSPTDTTPAPTHSPTDPTKEPTHSPTGPTAPPTRSPTDPTKEPTPSPTNTTAAPTRSPTSSTPAPTKSPTNPTAPPTPVPTDDTPSPTKSPTNPTAAPTVPPTSSTPAPTHSPTGVTASPSHSPTNSTVAPSESPTHPSMAPSGAPTIKPHASGSTNDTKKQNTLIIALIVGLAILLIIAGGIWAYKKHQKSGVDNQNLIAKNSLNQ